MRRTVVTLLAIFAGAVGAVAAATAEGAPLLLRTPTVSATSVVFNYGGDLWIVGPRWRRGRAL